MSDFGLTNIGFKRKRLADIKTEIEEAIIEEFGEVNLEPDSVFGQLVGIFAKPIAELWEEAENVYFSQYPATADGVSLDNAVDLIGVSRLQATRTRVLAALTGDQGTAIPAGTQVEVAETGEIFQNPEAGVITRSNALNVVLEVSLVLAMTDYTVVINGAPFIHNSGSSPTAESIALGLVSQINLNISDPVEASHIEGGIFELNTTQNETGFNTVISAGLVITSRTSPLLFESLEFGPVQVLTGTLTEIVTPVSGWDSVTNLDPSVQGRRLETDQELRLRRLQSFRVAGAGSVEAIQARLRQNVQDVTGAFVFENREPFEDAQGRPPHSFEAVVTGGFDTEIAQEIWEVKPAGIQTFGNVNVLIEDSNGDSQLISFSRPEPVYIWIQCNVRILAGVFPAEGVNFIRENLLEFGNDLNVGDKIIYQQFYSPVYQVSGVLEVTLLFGTSEDPSTSPSSFASENIPISQTEIADFNEDRINVSIV